MSTQSAASGFTIITNAVIGNPSLIIAGIILVTFMVTIVMAFRKNTL